MNNEPNANNDNSIHNNSNNKRRWGVLITTLVVGVAAYLATTVGDIETPLPDVTVEPNIVLPAGTPTPAGYVAGLCDVRNFASGPTPVASQVCTGRDIYANTVQPNLTVTPDWSSAKTRVAQNAVNGLKSADGIQIFSNVARVTATPGTLVPYPDAIYMPVGVPTVAYSAGQCTEYAPNYGSQTFIDWYDDLVISYCSWANTNTNVAIIPLQLGSSSETTNTYADVAVCGANKQQALESIVSGEDYKNWVKHAIVTWKTYCPNKMFTLATHLSSVYGEQGWKSAQYWMNWLVPSTPTPGAPPSSGAKIVPTPIYGVMDRFNGLKYGDPDAYRYGTPAPWGNIQSQERNYGIGGGGAFETYYSPSSIAAIPTAERIGDARDMTLSALGPGRASNLFYQFTSGGVCGWDCYIDAWLAGLINKTAGTGPTDSSIAWVRFRDAERGKYGGSNFELSDWPGPYTHITDVEWSAEPTRYCWTSIYNTGIATPVSSFSTPQVCQVADATTNPQTRYNLQFPASTIIGLNFDWSYTGKFTRSYTYNLTYYDNVTTSNWLEIHYMNSSDVDTTISINGGGTNTWVTATGTISAQMYDAINGEYDITIENNTSAVKLYFFSVETTIATPYPTSTATFTPTSTRTSQPTRTPSTPVATSTYTATPTASNTPASYTVVDAGPARTTYISRGQTSPAGTNQSINYAGYDQGNSQVMLLKWPELQKPAASYSVRSATITYKVLSVSDTSLTYNLDIQQLLKNWSDTATWYETGTTDVTGDSESWDVPGALSTGKDRDSGLYSATVRGSTVGTTGWSYVIDVTTIVRNWLDSGQSNYGVGIYMTNPCTTACQAQYASIAAGAYEVVASRPVLTVTYNYAVVVSPTPTATYTSTPPPTLVPTQPTATPTFTGTPTSTPTPIPGLKINEICPNPGEDFNMDGSLTNDDRALELFNPDNVTYYLVGYILQWGSGDPAYTYKFPSYVRIDPGSYKVIYSFELRNAYGQKFTMPGGPDFSATTVRLYKPGTIAPLDEFTYYTVSNYTCWQRYPNGSYNWTYYRTPTLGKVN